MASSIGGRISRTEVLSRADFWVQQGVTYGTEFDDHDRVIATKSAPDPDGKKYRTDCSGLVAMCWHLANSPTTMDFNGSWSQKVKLPSQSDLRAGDAMVKNGHIEMFARWVNPKKHSDGAFVYSFNRLGQTVENPNHPSNFDHLGKDSKNELDGYTPIRYKNIVDDASVFEADGAFLREPDGAICLVVGGCPFHLTPGEYAALGSPPFLAVDDDTFDKMPDVIRNGALIHVGDSIFIVAGSAKHHLTFADWSAMGKPASVAVPARFADALDSSPADNTILRDMHSGAVFQIVGDAKHHLTPAEYAGLGRPAATNVPTGFIDDVTGKVPDGTHFLRNHADGAIFLTVGGAKFKLSPAEYQRLRRPAFIEVPISFIDTFGEIPQDNTFLRDPDDGEIFQVLDGTKRHLTAAQWDALGEQTYTNVPQAFLDKIPDH